MNEELTKEMMNRAAAAVSAMADKLGVASEFVFRAATKYEFGEAIGVLVCIVVSYALLFVLWTKCAPWAFRLIREDDELTPAGVIFLIAIGLMSIFAVPITLTTIPVCVATLSSPEYSAFMSIMKLVKK